MSGEEPSTAVDPQVAEATDNLSRMDVDERTDSPVIDTEEQRRSVIRKRDALRVEQTIVVGQLSSLELKLMSTNGLTASQQELLASTRDKMTTINGQIQTLEGLLKQFPPLPSSTDESGNSTSTTKLLSTNDKEKKVTLDTDIPHFGPLGSKVPTGVNVLSKPMEFLDKSIPKLLASMVNLA
ncbi:hypothetical protein BGW42_007298 [Actinomortierella wolfii]|nr:hypothetical protein BGW42_007298 [Actinomortierella wolfii]